MTLGHRVALLRDGLLQQYDTPRVLYERPANAFVAGFIGSPAMNLLTVPRGANGSVALGGAQIRLPASARGEVVVGFRPESLELAADGIAAQVEVVEEIGADAHVFCVAEIGGERTKLVARTDARTAPAQGALVRLRPKADEAHCFDAETGERLG
jgi:multiple sugar transport system ATP-binding protein